MPYRMLWEAARAISLPRLALLLVLLYTGVYATIRVAIPWLVSIDVPFWIRALFLAGGAVLGVGFTLILLPWLFPHRR